MNFHLQHTNHGTIAHFVLGSEAIYESINLVGEVIDLLFFAHAGTPTGTPSSTG